jgi:hypothetical protein
MEIGRKREEENLLIYSQHDIPGRVYLHRQVYQVVCKGVLLKSHRSSSEDGDHLWGMRGGRLISSRVGGY